MEKDIRSLWLGADGTSKRGSVGIARATGEKRGNAEVPVSANTKPIRTAGTGQNDCHKAVAEGKRGKHTTYWGDYQKQSLLKRQENAKS